MFKKKLRTGHFATDLALLYAQNFFRNLVVFGAVSVPFYLYRAKLDYSRMFILEAIFSVCLILFEVPTGYVADRFGRKLSLVAGGIFYGISFLIFGFFINFWILAFAELICALGMSLNSGADKALVYDILKSSGSGDKALKTLARYDVFSTAGLLAGLPAGSMLVASGWLEYKAALGFVFILTAASIFLSVVIMLFVKEPFFAKREGSFIKEAVEGIRFIFIRPDLRIFSLNYSILSALTFFMFWLYQSMLIEIRFPAGLFGWIGAGANIAAILLLFRADWISKKFGLRNTIFLTGLLPGILYLVLFLWFGPVTVFIGIFGIIAMKIFRTPVLGALMNRSIDSYNRATVLSGISMLERVVTAIFYPAVGFLMDHSMRYTFLTLGVAVLVIAFLIRVEERHLETTDGD